ncbi:MAG: hypothetical protein ACOZIN_07955 [Myxococcota bacterium]
MNYPPRLGHLATRAVIGAKLLPTYAKAHGIDDDEAAQRLSAALAGQLYERLLAAAWEAMLAKKKRLDDAGLLEKVAESLRERPMRPGRTAELNPSWSAFLVVADLETGTASEAARRVMESVEGQQKAAAGLAEVGRFLAAELTRPG